jgi:hypothetical protein
MKYAMAAIWMVGIPTMVSAGAAFFKFAMLPLIRSENPWAFAVYFFLFMTTAIICLGGALLCLDQAMTWVFP